MFKYKKDDKINDLTVVKCLNDVGHPLYYLKCKCGRYMRVYEVDLPKENCGECYKQSTKVETGRSEIFTDDYKNWRKGVMGRDKFKCRVCGRKNTDLEAHHLDGWNWCIAKRYDVGNGITICDQKGCRAHTMFHDKYGKGNNTRQQFDDFLKKFHATDLGELGL